MALKAGTVGVNPDILDNSGRVKELPAGEHDLSFEVDEATGKAGYKIDGGSFHPFEEAGVTVYGWVKPADLTAEGLTANTNVDLYVGGFKEDNDKVYVDITIGNKSNSEIAANTLLVSGLPSAETNRKFYFNEALLSFDKDEAAAADYRSSASSSSIIMDAYMVTDKLYFSSAIPAGAYFRIYGVYLT